MRIKSIAIFASAKALVCALASAYINTNSSFRMIDAGAVLLAYNLTSWVEANGPLWRALVLTPTLAVAPNILVSPASAAAITSAKTTNGAPLELGT